MAATILVVEDERKIVEMVRLYLERDGHRVVVAQDGRDALTAFRRERPDLIVLDLLLPEVDGLEVCRTVREQSDVPILMLTARSEEADKLVGLELGADDYVTKPFSPRELAARVRAVLRRARTAGAPRPDRIEVGGLMIDVASHEVTCDGASVSLTPTEFKILWALARQPGRVLTRPQLLDEALGERFEGYERTIDVHIKNLRRKLNAAAGRSCIQTVFGVGYKLAEAESA